MTRIIRSLGEVSERYDALLVDLWGCVHDGLAPYPEAVAALQGFREEGGAVILLTNAPRDHHRVARHLARMGVPETAWDAIATSGDAARAAMYRGVVGRKVWYIGEAHDEGFFDSAETVADPVEITRVGRDEAEGIVCCGPFDPHGKPESWRADLLFAKQKGLKLLCANPDIVVDRGERREWCAGAMAKMYGEMGGESLYFGKPHPPIYDLAQARLSALGRVVPPARILAIGDGIATDIAGAIGEDIDAMFVTGGLSVRETGSENGEPDPELTRAFLQRHQLSPRWVIGGLR